VSAKYHAIVTTVNIKLNKITGEAAHLSRIRRTGLDSAWLPLWKSPPSLKNEIMALKGTLAQVPSLAKSGRI
jgi:hypothetical protein